MKDIEIGSPVIWSDLRQNVLEALGSGPKVRLKYRISDGGSSHPGVETIKDAVVALSSIGYSKRKPRVSGGFVTIVLTTWSSSL